MVFWTHFMSVFSDPGYLIQDSFEASSLTNVQEVKEDTRKVKQQILDKRKKIR